MALGKRDSPLISWLLDFAWSICMSLKPVPCANGCRIISLFLGGSGSFILPCKVSLIPSILKVSWLTTCSRVDSSLVGELGFEPLHSHFTVCHNTRYIILYLKYSTYHIPSYKVIVRLFWLEVLGLFPTLLKLSSLMSLGKLAIVMQTRGPSTP